MPYSIKKQKELLRALKKKEISALSEQYIIDSDDAITRRLCSLPEYKNARVIFAYYSVGREVSTHKLLRTALNDGRKVALPLSGSDGMMSFHLISSLDGLRSGKFGIPEPVGGEEALPTAEDIIIVPALCCDKNNARLGHGGGYYDRYLAGKPCFSVCLCRKKLLEEHIPTQETDNKVSIVITD